MNRSLTTLLAIALLAAAGAVAAQSPAAQSPAAQPPAPQQPATGIQAPLPPERGSRASGTTLNLQLDDTSRRRIMSGAIEEGSRSGKDLPAIGEGARPLDHTQRSSPYPQQYNDIPAR